jgi:hypothetical protein
MRPAYSDESMNSSHAAAEIKARSTAMKSTKARETAS